jgi:hypothetical protein
MTLKDVFAYLLCAAGIVLAIATWCASLGWGWGVLAVVLFASGWCLLRSARDGVADNIGDAVEAVIDAVDLD